MEQAAPLSNLERELLKVFAMNADDQYLLKIKSLLAKFFAEKAAESADKAWEDK